MTVAAFTYHMYSENPSPRDHYRGEHQDSESAREVLRGGRYVNNVLELFDMESGKWEYYKWLPLYKDEELRNIDGSFCDPQQIFLTHRFDERLPSITIVFDSPARGYAVVPEKKGDRLHYGLGNLYYEAGEWVLPEHYDLTF